MRFRNKVTGTVIETPCAVAGEDWERVDEAPSPTEPRTAARAVPTGKKETGAKKAAPKKAAAKKKVTA